MKNKRIDELTAACRRLADDGVDLTEWAETSRQRDLEVKAESDAMPRKNRGDVVVFATRPGSGFVVHAVGAGVSLKLIQAEYNPKAGDTLGEREAHYSRTFLSPAKIAELGNALRDYATFMANPMQVAVRAGLDQEQESLAAAIAARQRSGKVSDSQQMTEALMAESLAKLSDEEKWLLEGCDEEEIAFRKERKAKKAALIAATPAAPVKAGK